MSISLKKGGSVNLSKESKSNLRVACVGLGWDFDSAAHATYDLDAWALPFKGSAQCPDDLVYFAHRKSDRGNMQISPDNLTGEGSGDDETLTFKLDSISPEYTAILIGVTIFMGKVKRQMFMNVRNAFVRIYDEETQTELCKYTDEFQKEFGKCTTMLFGVLLRTETGWVFSAIGEGRLYGKIEEVTKDKTILGLIEECQEKLNTESTTMEVKKSMAVSLSKGGKVSLAKTAATMGINNLVEINAGLHWDANRYDGGYDFDLDAMVFMTAANGKVRKDSDFVFYGNLKGDGVTHSGDERKGCREGDDETVNIKLNEVPADIQKITFCVTIHDAVNRGQNFGQVENCGIHIYDAVTGTNLVDYDLGEDFSDEAAVVVAELYRHNGDWKVNAVGSGFKQGLIALCANFGIDATMD